MPERALISATTVASDRAACGVAVASFLFHCSPAAPLLICSHRDGMTWRYYYIIKRDIMYGDTGMMCRYYQECEYAGSNAFTCTRDGGGMYCGKYRMLYFGYQDYSAVRDELESAARKYERLV
jgi:hypothetical protein